MDDYQPSVVLKLKRNPDWYVELHHRARKYYTDRLNQTSGLAQQRLMLDTVFLHRDNAVIRSFFDWQTTGSIDTISPKLCATERILIPIVDRMGESLYRRRAPLFIQKHYNPVYPLISFFEDLAN